MKTQDKTSNMQGGTIKIPITLSAITKLLPLQP